MIFINSTVGNNIHYIVTRSHKKINLSLYALQAIKKYSMHFVLHASPIRYTKPVEYKYKRKK